MVFKFRRGGVRARLLVGAALAAVALSGALAVPTAAGAATTDPADTTLVTLHGTTDDSLGCTRLTTADGSTYELVLPQNPTPDQRDLILNGIPLNVPVEVQAKQLTGVASFCFVGPVMEVESLTELLAFQGTTKQSATPGCTTLVTDRGGLTLELRLPENPTPDQQKLVQDGIPLGDVVQVALKPIVDESRVCSTTLHTLEVESLTILQETLDGLTDALEYCHVVTMTAADGTVYELEPAPGTDPIPRGVRVEIKAKLLPGPTAVPCGANGVPVEVESFSVLPVQEATFDGTASQVGTNCTRLTTTDGDSYELYLQTGMSPGPVSGPGPVTSIPLGVPIEVQGATGAGVTSNCDLGPIVVVEGLTVLDN